MNEMKRIEKVWTINACYRFFPTVKITKSFTHFVPISISEIYVCLSFSSSQFSLKRKSGAPPNKQTIYFQTGPIPAILHFRDI